MVARTLKPSRKYLFDRRFGDVAPPAGAEPAADVDPDAETPDVAAPPPTFSAEDLARAREDGRRDAAIEAASTAERMLSEQLDRIAGQLAAVLDQLDGVRAEASRDAVAVAAAVTRKIAPALSAAGAVDDVAETVAAVIARLVEVPSLTVNVAPAIADAVAERLLSVADTHGFAGRVRVNADPALSEGDCRIDWPKGGAARSGATLWREIDAILEAFGAGPKLVDEGSMPAAEPRLDAAPEPDAGSDDMPDAAPSPATLARDDPADADSDSGSGASLPTPSRAAAGEAHG